jgi:hypothetical protein
MLLDARCSQIVRFTMQLVECVVTQRAAALLSAQPRQENSDINE